INMVCENIIESKRRQVHNLDHEGVIRMKQHVIKAFCLSLLFIALVVSPLLIADENTVNLESRVIQTFDDPEAEPWFAIGSKFATKGFPIVQYVKTWPIAVFGSNPSNKDLKALGVAMLFDRKEYNWVDLIPGVKKGSGDNVTYEPKELDLPGRVKMIDIWIWSGNLNYYIEAYLRDYKGVVHTLPMGDLTHVGWKNFRINIPSSIPQGKSYLPKREGLRLVKLRIWARPTEVAAIPTSADAPNYEKAIYFYFDQLKVLTDTFETLFDGDALADPNFMKETWGSQTDGK
ncbi:MAG TPA: flagellar filament outer layer protein FlaA, partial [Spirochaetales bacterium]|nr:flagellar filament outer layer protein FlaA [Spirochaetales bacterium]